MKSKLNVTSVTLLFALAISLISAAANPSSVSAAVCFRAQFIADVTVPDGTNFAPGTAFKKTWRLKNVGACAWNSLDITLIFDSGAQMGAPASVTLPSTVAPGQTVDLSVDMTAPPEIGHYIGYWKLHSAQGLTFGIGVNADKAWWVEINVTGTPTSDVAYDFTANAGSAIWYSGLEPLPFPGTDGDSRGFALKKDKPKFENGVEASQPGLLFAPRNITNGYIQAQYPAFKVQGGDRFQTTVGCEFGATSCYVAYRLNYEDGNTIRTFWAFRERYEGWTYNANLDLSPLAGKEVRFILYSSAYGSPTGDRALWGNPVIIRKGGVTPPSPTVTGTPPTSTPSNTPVPTTFTVPPSSCDKAQFIADVNFPDGSILQPGTQFTKTWRLKNVGACAWSTSYQLVFFSGEMMGAAALTSFTKNVAVGQTVDISMNMVAPTAPGSYRGFWMFKNANGALFGIGAQANKPWWVDIQVAGTTVTPGGSRAQPDLIVTQMKVELPNPGCLSPGDAFGLRVWIANIGQASAGSFAVQTGSAQQTVDELAAGVTKTVFFPDYSNPNNSPVTVTVDPGGVIAESNEQNNTRTETLFLLTPTPPAPCTPSPTSTVYQNTKYGFKFTLPTGAIIQSQSDTAGRVNLPFAGGTNLVEKYVQVTVVENASPCISPVMDGSSASTASVIINSIQFTKQVGQGIATGNFYDWVAYSTVRNNACISLTFILHSVDPGLYSPPLPAYDKNAESAVFATTMSTFTWINP